MTCISSLFQGSPGKALQKIKYHGVGITQCIEEFSTFLEDGVLKKEWKHLLNIIL